MRLAQPGGSIAKVSVLPFLPEDGRRSSFRNVVILLKYRRWTMSKKPLSQITNETCFELNSSSFLVCVQFSSVSFLECGSFKSLERRSLHLCSSLKQRGRNISLLFSCRLYSSAFLLFCLHTNHRAVGRFV
jgi:hypothetical protein